MAPVRWIVVWCLATTIAGCGAKSLVTNWVSDLTVSITQPTETISTNGKVTVSVEVSQESYWAVDLLANGNVVVRLNPPYTYVWDTQLIPEGTYNLEAQIALTGLVAKSESIIVMVDHTAPYVLSTLPPSNSQEIPLATTLSGTFNEPINGDSLLAESFKVMTEGEAAEGEYSYDEMAQSATWLPTSTLKLLAPYQATLSNNITDLAGNSLENDYQWDFLTVDGTWNSEDQSLSTGPDNSNFSNLAVVPSGEAIAIWVKEVAGNNGVTSTYFDPEHDDWGAEQTLDKYSGDAQLAKVTMNEQGQAMAIWVQEDIGSMPTAENIYSVLYTSATDTWTEANVPLDSDVNDNPATSPQISLNDNGFAIASWLQEEPGIHAGIKKHVYVSTYNPFSGWTADPPRLDTLDYDVSEVQAALFSDGTGLVLWTQRAEFGPLNTCVSTATYSGTTWSEPSLISNNTNLFASDLHLAFTKEGDAMVVFTESPLQSQSGANTQIMLSTFDGESKNWSIPATLTTTVSKTNKKPRIAMNSSGHAVVAWLQEVNSTDNDAMAVIFNGTWQTSTIKLNTQSKELKDIHVSIDSSGNAMVVWSEGGKTILATRYRAATEDWGSSITLGNGQSGAALPQIATNGRNEIFAIWEQETPSNNLALYFNHFK